MELYAIFWGLFGMVVGAFVGFLLGNDKSNTYNDPNVKSIDTSFVDYFNKYHNTSNDNSTLGGTK